MKFEYGLLTEILKNFSLLELVYLTMKLPALLLFPAVEWELAMNSQLPYLRRNVPDPVPDDIVLNRLLYLLSRHKIFLLTLHFPELRSLPFVEWTLNDI